MTGGTVIILGSIGDNFAAGMTGGMAFVYDPLDQFEKKVNAESVIWQRPETNYWIEELKSMIKKHLVETNSSVAKEILENFENELKNFYQVCPKEMLDKLESPITKKISTSKAS